MNCSFISGCSGQLWIAEVRSRFAETDGDRATESEKKGVDAFVHAVEAIGFKLKRSDKTSTMFVRLDFVRNDASASKKSRKAKKMKGEAPQVDAPAFKSKKQQQKGLLKACVYKKR